MPDEYDRLLDSILPTKRGRRLSPPEIADTLRQAGWEERHVPTMTAIAQAESSGNPAAHNPRYPDDSYGLLQVNRLAHPQYSPDTLKDPVGNARAALDVFKKQGLKAWSTYTSGAYRKHLGQVSRTPAKQRDVYDDLLDKVLQPSEQTLPPKLEPIKTKQPATSPAPATSAPSYNTQLTPAEEVVFKQWKRRYAPRDSGADYDLRGAFKEGLTPDPRTGHWPDKYKKPNHPTFSVESQYATGANVSKAGRWEGEKFIPAAPTLEQTLQNIMRSTNEATARLKRQAARQPPPPNPLMRQYGRQKTIDETQRAREEQARQEVIAERARRKIPFTSLGTMADLISSPVQSITRALKPEEEQVAEQVQERLKRQQLAEEPEVMELRKEYGSYPAALRAVAAPAARGSAGLIQSLGGVVSGLGIAPNRVSDWLQKRAEIAEAGASNTPLRESRNLSSLVTGQSELEEVERGVPEKIATGVADLGVGIGSIILLKKATGLPFNQLLALEGALKHSDKPVEQQLGAATEGYALGTALDSHLGRKATATLFGAPTAAQTGYEVSQGRMSPLDAAIQTGVQAGAGFVLGGKRPSPLRRRLAEIAQAESEALPGERVFNRERRTRYGRQVETPPGVATPGGISGRQVRGAGHEEVVQEVRGRPAERGVAEGAPGSETPTSRQWQHADFGLVTEAPNQTGVGRRKVRVTAEDGSEHVIKRAALTGAGNQRAIPVRVAQPSVTTPVTEPAQPPAGEARRPPTIPERPATLAAQFTALREGRREAVLVPRGTQADIPPGLASEPTPEGSLYFDPRQMSPETVRRSIADNAYGQLLGHVEPKPAPGEPLAVVTAREGGTEVQSSVVSPRRAAEQAGETQARHPEAEVRVGGPELAEEVVRERLAPTRPAAGEPGRQPSPPPSSPSTPPSVEPKGVKPPTRPETPDSTTAVKNAALAADRAALDLPELAAAEPRRAAEVHQRAIEANTKDPRAVDTLVNQALQGDQNYTDIETAQVRLRAQEIKNRIDTLNRELAGETDTQTIRDKGAQVDTLVDEFDRLSQATRKAGTEWGRAGVARQQPIDQDLNLASMVAGVRRVAKRKETPAERREIEILERENTRLQNELAKVESRRRAGESVEAADRFVTEERIRVRSRKPRSSEARRADRERIKSELSALVEAPSLKAFLKSEKGAYDPEKAAHLARLLRDLARNYIEEGVVKADELVRRVHNEVRGISDLTRREVSDLISGYGRTSKPTQDAVERKLNELKSILAATSGKADVLEAGIRPARRGQQREKPTEDQRRALRELNEAMRRKGVELAEQPYDPATEQATPLDKAKTTTRNRIEQLKSWIAAGKREVQGKQQVIPDAELTRLRTERDVLEKVAVLLDDPAADARAVEQRLTQLNQQINKKRQQIQTGKIQPEAREGVAARWTPEIGQLERERNALGRIIGDMRREADRKPVDEFQQAARRELNRRKQIEQEAAELERRIAAKDFSPRTREKPVYSAETRKLEEELQHVRNKYQLLLDRAKPGHFWRTLSGLRKSWMLSGISTQAKNIGGTGGYQVFDEIARLPAVIVDAAIAPVTGKRSVMGPSPVAALDSVLHAVKVGGREAGEILRVGATKEQLERHQFSEIDTGVKLIDFTGNLVFRFMSASDRVFYQGAYRRNLVDRAQVQARNEGLRGEHLQRRARELVDNPTEDLDAAAKHDALVATFNNSNKLSDAIKGARAQLGPKANFAIDMVMPFDRTPTNVIARIVEASPVGYVQAATGGFRRSPRQVIKSIINKTMTVEEQRQFSLTMGRATAGTAIIGLGWVLADTLFDVEEYQVFLKVPGLGRINLTSISPVGNLLALGARWRKNYNEGKPFEAVKTAGRVPLDQPLLRAGSEASELLRDPQRSLTRTLARQASSFIPFGGLVRDVAKTIDPEQRRYPDPQSFTEQVQQNIPGLRQRLPVSRSRVFGGQAASSSATEEIGRLNMRLPGTRQRENEPDEQFNVRKQARDFQAVIMLEGLVQSPEYQGLSDEDKRKRVRAVLASLD